VLTVLRLVKTDFDREQMKRVLVRQAASYVTHGLLYGLGYLPTRHKPRRASDIRTVVFVHGLAGNRANFFPAQAYLGAVGHRRQYSFNYRSRGSIERLALLLKRRIDENVKGGAIDIVAHSMGGIVARYYLQILGGHRRVDRLITLATPHFGTHSSAYVPSGLVSQLRPGGPFLRYLNGLEPPQGVQCHSFGGRDELVVLPPSSALAPFGETVMLEDMGHMDMLLSPRVFAAVHARLRQPLVPTQEATQDCQA
jgi:triacylglycerol lipase